MNGKKKKARASYAERSSAEQIRGEDMPSPAMQLELADTVPMAAVNHRIRAWTQFRVAG